ncbi:MAG: hypothetical protein LCI00_25310 [Chloroflexi bacterium]|nr:hypothetical protein [Chloroflexota bacterium]MCC6894914.1 hypothetical protein [Anaerolineae bacterium]
MENQPAPRPQSGAKTYEMLWDCKFCGTKKLLGKTHRFCPNCGGQQDPSWRYFPSDSEKVAVQDHIYVGADKICKACSSLNGGAAEFCGNCGAPLSGAATAGQVAGRTKAEGESFETENLQQRQQGTQVPALGIAAAATKPAQSSGGINKWLIIGVIVVALIGGAIFALTRTVKASAYVTGYKWERTINLQSLQPVHDKTNCDRMPGDAYSVSRSYEQVDTRQIPDGQTCTTNQIDQGDGTFREERSCETNYRSEPVMGYMCTYMVNRWVGASPAVARGDKTNAPYWPDTNVSTSCFTIGCKRESGRDEDYILMLKGDGDRPFECEVNYDLWQESKLERSFDVEVGTVLKNFVCSSLKPTT